ncbi:MAG: di-heme oxidoredictase family protein [Magnetospiraceae bacterium]
MSICWRNSLFGVLAVLLTPGPVQADALDVALGKALFDRNWTSSPASTDATDGLGPLFNARSCAACHPGGERGVFTEGAQGRIDTGALVLRIGDVTGAGDPTYGRQLQTDSVQGLRPEGQLQRRPDGSLVAVALTQGSLGEGVKAAGRLAPHLRGLGLLDQVPESVILAWEDPEDKNGDGISGRANRLSMPTGAERLGRYGWKAGEPSLTGQIAQALRDDIGLSNPLHPEHQGDCTDRQVDCLAAPPWGQRPVRQFRGKWRHAHPHRCLCGGLAPTHPDPDSGEPRSVPTDRLCRLSPARTRNGEWQDLYPFHRSPAA